MRNERAGVHSSPASLPDDLFQSPVSARHLSECTVPVVWEILVNLSIVLGGPRDGIWAYVRIAVVRAISVPRQTMGLSAQGRTSEHSSARVVPKSMGAE